MIKINRIADKSFILIFLLVIYIPGIGIFIQRSADDARIMLNREPHQFPAINIKKLGRTNFKDIENWFIDKALFITSLNKLWSNFNYRLGNSIKPEEVIVGKDGWLFLGNNYAATIDQYTGRNIPTSEEIRTNLQSIKHLNQIAKQNNIPFLFLIAPDKQDIYPEYLPSGIKPGLHLTRLDYLQEEMRTNNINYIDLRSIERQAKLSPLSKKYGALYFKGDSHWNYLGAYVAYQEIANFLQQAGFVSRPVIKKFLPNVKTTTDLTTLLQLTDVKSNNPIPDIANLNIDIVGRDYAGNYHQMTAFESIPAQVILKEPYQVINKALTNQQVCLLIGDSFSNALEFYFHNDCHSTIRIHLENTTYRLSKLINTYHPNIIVYERIERNLAYRILNR
jgi:hypothetical protein